MSYVLDALKRADAERERGAVPGLHAQPVPLLPAETDEPRSSVPWLWLGVGLAIGLLAAFALLVAGREPVREPVAAATVAPMPPPASLQVPVPPPAAAPVRPPMGSPAAQAPRLPAVATSTAVPAARTAQTPASAPAEPAVTALHELPESVRRELPTLTVGGSVYSSDPAQRFLVINGQIVHEKDEIAPGLRLEQIKLKSAVLRYKDVRYSISF